MALGNGSRHIEQWRSGSSSVLVSTPARCMVVISLSPRIKKGRKNGEVVAIVLILFSELGR